MTKPYHYKAKVTSVYDGDTLTVNIDLGFGIVQQDRVIRLWKVNTPEMKGDDKARGKFVRDTVRGYVLNRWVTVRTILDKRERDRRGKYGRLLGEILFERDGEQVNLNSYLLEQGLAVPYGEDGAAVRSVTVGTRQKCRYCGEGRIMCADGVSPCGNCGDG